METYYFIRVVKIYNLKGKVKEDVAQWVRALDALSEDLGSILSAHVMVYKHLLMPVPGTVTVSFCLSGTAT